MAVYEFLDDSEMLPFKAQATATPAEQPRRQSVGVYTAESVQPDGIFVQALSEDAAPKLKAIVRNYEKAVCERLSINSDQLGKVQISDKAHNEMLAWSAYKAFDLDVTPQYLKKAIIPAEAKAIGVTATGMAATILASAVLGTTGLGLGIYTALTGGLLVWAKLSTRVHDNAEKDLPTVERAIQLKLDAREKKYQL